MTDKDIVAIYGRLMAHEFLLEVTWANALASANDEFAEETFRQLKNRSRVTQMPQGSDPSEADQVLEIGRECSTVIERFCEKVRARRDNLRAIRSQAEADR